jgi:hypothetical protein
MKRDHQWNIKRSRQRYCHRTVGSKMRVQQAKIMFSQVRNQSWCMTRRAQEKFFHNSKKSGLHQFDWMTGNVQSFTTAAANVHRIEHRERIRLRPYKRFRNWQKPISKYSYRRHANPIARDRSIWRCSGTRDQNTNFEGWLINFSPGYIKDRFVQRSSCWRNYAISITVGAVLSFPFSQSRTVQFIAAKPPSVSKLAQAAPTHE